MNKDLDLYDEAWPIITKDGVTRDEMVDMILRLRNAWLDQRIELKKLRGEEPIAWMYWPGDGHPFEAYTPYYNMALRCDPNPVPLYIRGEVPEYYKRSTK